MSGVLPRHGVVERDADSRAEEVYFGKAKDVVGDLRSICYHHSGYSIFDANYVQGIQPLTESNRDKATHQQMINSISSKAAQ